MKITKRITNKLYAVAYHILECLDGERKKHLKVIPYIQAERIKLAVLRHIH